MDLRLNDPYAETTFFIRDSLLFARPIDRCGANQVVLAVLDTTTFFQPLCTAGAKRSKYCIPLFTQYLVLTTSYQCIISASYHLVPRQDTVS
jgi:hypothetical protein